MNYNKTSMQTHRTQTAISSRQHVRISNHFTISLESPHSGWNMLSV